MGVADLVATKATSPNLVAGEIGCPSCKLMLGTLNSL